jgi:hypothetical protein
MYAGFFVNAYAETNKKNFGIFAFSAQLPAEMIEMTWCYS